MPAEEPGGVRLDSPAAVAAAVATLGMEAAEGAGASRARALSSICLHLTSTPSAFSHADDRDNLKTSLQKLVLEPQLTATQRLIASRCCLLLQAQIFPPAFKSGGPAAVARSWRWSAPESSKPTPMLDRAALVGSLDEYADCLSDPTAPKHRLNLGASITGLLAVAEFYRDALSHDHIMVFELFIISQLQAEQPGGGPGGCRGDRPGGSSAAGQARAAGGAGAAARPVLQRYWPRQAPLGASLRRASGAAPELELALLPLLMCHGPAVPRAVNPGPSISSFLQASLPHAWSNGTVALRTFETACNAIRAALSQGAGALLPTAAEDAAWYPHLMTEETVVGLHAALLDMPFLVMALERSPPWELGRGHVGLISGLALGGGGGHGGGDASATGSGSSAAQQAQAYLEALAGCNSAAEYRRCAPRAPPVGGFLGGVAAK
eukprot:jgi/Tetstr1/448375/TSEL_035657.t1